MTGALRPSAPCDGNAVDVPTREQYRVVAEHDAIDDARGIEHKDVVALLAIVVAVSVLALDALAGAATPPVGKRGIDVVQVEGYLDPPNVSLILDAIKESNARRSTLLVLQVKSNGAIDTNIDEVVRAIQKSRVPVAVWVGPSGADAKGATALILEAAHFAYVSPGSGAGAAQPVRLDDPGASTRAEVADQLAALAARRGREVVGLDGHTALSGAMVRRDLSGATRPAFTLRGRERHPPPPAGVSTGLGLGEHPGDHRLRGAVPPRPDPRAARRSDRRRQRNPADLLSPLRASRDSLPRTS